MNVLDILESWAKLINASVEEKKEANRRLDICKNCKKLSKIYFCKECGCPVGTKVFTKNPCPKWNL